MCTMQKCLVVFGMGVIGVIGVLLMSKTRQHAHHTGMYEKAGQGIDEKLMESKVALDKASAHVQSVFEHMKNRKT